MSPVANIAFKQTNYSSKKKKMPSVAQINEINDGAVLTGFSTAQGKKALIGENEHFTNGIELSKPQNLERHETDNINFTERNGNHVISAENGALNGHNGNLSNANSIISTEKVEITGNGFSHHEETETIVAGARDIHKSFMNKHPDSIAPSEEGSKYKSKSAHPSLDWKLNEKEYTQGPDQLLPSRALTTWYADGAVKLSSKGVGKFAELKPKSVPTLFKQAVDIAPNRLAMSIKRKGKWQKWTYTQYHKDVRTVAKAFIALGLERFHSVCILGFNSPEWFISDLAAIHAGGFAAGVYTTNNPEACQYVANDSKANIFIVEDDTQLQKILAIRKNLPNLKAIVQYDGDPTDEGVYSWSKLLMLGQQQSDTILEERLKQIAVNQCCTLIYTSGTTGNPKGVMLSHDNLVWIATVNKDIARFYDKSEEYVSFLPLSHVAAQVADIYCNLTCAGTVYFADKNAFKGTLMETMKEVRPTKFFAVPRVWEKMYEKMSEIGRNTKGIKRVLATWAKSKGLEYNMKRMNGDPHPETIGFKIADKLILSKVRAALGLDRSNFFLSAAAPISPEIIKYFWSLNILLVEAYGMSECSGDQTMGLESQFRIGSVGKTIPGAETKIDKPDADGNGEILMGGRHVQMGYLLQPEKTHNTIDDAGWLHSEDIGKVDKDGYLFITGRLKELLITAGGENIAPVPIEDNVKTAMPIVSQAICIGDKLKFLSVLLTLKTEVDPDTQEPLDKLIPSVSQWMNEYCDEKITTVSQVIKEIKVKHNAKLLEALQNGINEANKKAVSQAQKLQKFVILPKDFSVPGGELGPTLKLKRNVIHEIYKSTIQELYN